MRDIGFLFGFWAALLLGHAALAGVVIAIVVLSPGISEPVLWLMVLLLWWALVEALRYIRRRAS